MSPRRQAPRLGVVVGDDEDGGAPISEALQLPEDGSGPFAIDTGERFVEQQNGWIVQGCPGQRQALFESARQVASGTLAKRLQPGPLQGIINPVGTWLNTVEASEEQEVLPARQIVVEHRLMGNEANISFFVHRVFSPYQNLASSRLAEPCHKTQKGRFTRSVRTDDQSEGPDGERQTERAKSSDRTILFGNLGEGEGRRGFAHESLFPSP